MSKTTGPLLVVPIALLLLVSGAPAGAELVHKYSLDNNLSDDLGGPSLIADGGTLEQGGGYSFGPNQGLRLVGPSISPTTYSIAVIFSWNTLPPGWFKIIDLSDRTNDSGLYTFDDGHACYWAFGSHRGPAGVFQAGQLARVLLVRDDLTKLVQVFVDGIEQLSFVDSADQAVLTGTALTFFEDDVTTGFREAGSGFVESIRVFDAVRGPVEESLSAIVETVLELDIAGGVSTSLDQKLDAALQALDDVNANNDGAAINSLQAFISATEAQRGKKISEDEADALIAEAQAIIDLLLGQ